MGCNRSNQNLRRSAEVKTAAEDSTGVQYLPSRQSPPPRGTIRRALFLRNTVIYTLIHGFLRHPTDQLISRTLPLGVNKRLSQGSKICSLRITFAGSSALFSSLPSGTCLTPLSVTGNYWNIRGNPDQPICYAK